MSAVASAPDAEWSTALILRFLWRLAVIALVLAALSWHFSAEVADLMLPAIGAEINWLDDTYKIEKLLIDHEGADRVVRVWVSLAHCIVLNGRAFCGDPRGLANASTLVGNLTLPLTLLISFAMAWPVRRDHHSRGYRDYLLRALALAPLSAILLAVDVPMVLWSSLWSLHHDAFAPDQFSPLIFWTEFLQGGGRLALSAAAGLVTALLLNARRSAR